MANGENIKFNFLSDQEGLIPAGSLMVEVKYLHLIKNCYGSGTVPKTY